MAELFGLPIRESVFCARDTALIVRGGGVILPELGIWRLTHGGRLPFECAYSAGERERRRWQRRQAHA